ncbi:E3 ubiquitin-protein ligase HRD1 [Leucoagaricus sp. SymC.cos]|nr:E3 ubiquitin-protein ligase HRD1 [Leucoagaricus sp. SymC.cos]
MPPLDLALRQRTSTLFRSFASHRIQLYSLISVIAVSAVVLNALRNYSNFYSVSIYLSKSGRSVLVLANFAVLLALFCGHVVQRIFFGALRPNEVERLYDRLWFFITESLLAFTIFRDEFDIPFVLMFGFLLFVKSFHWLAGDRIEWMDQQPYPGPSPLFHLRMTSLFVILWLTDFVMFVVAIDHTITYGVGGMVLFASEYGILMASIMNTILKYLLSAYDLRRAGRRGGENAPPWENKSMWIFYIELATDFLKLTTYLVFFTIIITFYGLPLNLIRDVYITARSFITRLRALHRYQTATRNMDQRYPNATEAELTAMSDHTCIICREDMVVPRDGQAPANEGPNMTPKKLPCGHIFHFHCLRSWLERQQSCPTCRQTVLETNAPQPPANGPPPAVPQQGNNPAVAQPGNNPPAVNNPMGNPFGLLGRILAPPGQNINRNQAVPARLAQNQGVNGQRNPIVIEYHVQYQGPHTPGTARTGQHDVPHPPATLQPIQPLDGFAGPNGAWQRWPEQRHNAAFGNQNLPNQATSEEGTSRVPPSSGERAANEAAMDSEDPRSAAALAALRRLNGNSTPAHTSPSASSTEGSNPLEANSKASSATTPANSVPKLIPLFDLSGQQLGERSQSTVNSIPAPNNTQSIYTNPGTSLSHLPQQITDAQLAIMDNLTREAMDERLRILENVSGTIHRCVEDLLRVRSALPITEAMRGNSQQPDTHTEHDPNESGSNDSSDEHLGDSRDKGKGVDRGAGNNLV